MASGVLGVGCRWCRSRLQHRWTQDEACRVVGWQVGRPETVEEEVDAVHEPVTDEKVASRIAADLLRRPEVTFQATADTTVTGRVAAALEKRSTGSSPAGPPPASRAPARPPAPSDPRIPKPTSSGPTSP